MVSVFAFKKCGINSKGTCKLIKKYKVTKVYAVISRGWNVINMCNFYVTDSEIYCNTRIHDIFENTRLIHEQN